MSTKVYSHSSIFHDGNLIVCGGVIFYPHSQYGDEGSRDIVTIINPMSKELSQVSVTHPSPILMHGHSCVKSVRHDEVVLVGGGDNCFSFGTCFICAPVSLKLS